MLLRLHWSTVAVITALSFSTLLTSDRAFDGSADGACPPPGYCVAVTPDGGYDPARAQNSGPHTSQFVVQNIGTQPDFYEFECQDTGGVTCSGVDLESASLSAGQQVTVTATYSIGSSGGTIGVKAIGPPTDSGYHNVHTPPNLALVMPAVTSSDTVLVHTRRPLILMNYSVNDAAIDTTSLVVKFDGETVTSLTRRNRRLMEWEVDSTRQLTPGTGKTLYVRICNIYAGCTIQSYVILLDNSGAPVVSFTGMPLEAQGRRFGAPFGPGISVSGADVETGFSVPSYVSMGVSRSIGLVYSTRQSYPRALVNADIELTWPAGTPDQIKAVLLDGTTRMDSLVVSSPSCSGAGGRHCRVTLQGDFSGTTWTGAQRKWLRVEISVTSSGTTKTTLDSTEVVLVDRRGSSYGRGWYVSTQLMIYLAGNDAILVSPTGSPSVYRGMDSLYLAPPGDAGVLVKAGSGWELRSRDGSKLVFDSLRRVSQAIDRYSNTTAFTYNSTTERMTQIADPVGHRFRIDSTTNKYTITDSMPAIATVRRTVFTLSSGNVVYDSIASPTSRPATGTFSYTSVGSNSANVLATRADAVGNTTTIAYDGRTRPTMATLPAVLPDTGSTPVSPVITYRAQELRGLDTLISIDSVFVQIKDPLANWTRSRLNRWGAAERSWDALGTLGRASYHADGRIVWREGKVADSTRVYFVYDAVGRLSSSHRLRTSTDTIFLSRLTYNNTDDVLTSRNALGLRDSVVYGTGGPTQRFTASNDKALFANYSNGQLDWSDPPGPTGRSTVAYDGTWKNVSTLTRAGNVAFYRFYDAFGRDTLTRSRTVVRVSGDLMDTTWYQWRRTRTRYNELNQVDTVVVERTDECTPCTTPPSFPGGTDYAHKVINRYDRLGRDSSRIGSSTNGPTLYLYDALGRLRRRHPYTSHGGAGVADSFRYDLAGNVRFQWTRRGTQIEHRYDSRYRDTLTIVPGVGNYRRTFGGPNDEVTRAWIDSYVDSITSVDPEVRWGYSQAGVLLADTAQGTHVTTYVYDRYGRDTLITDLVGTWQMRYDAGRGILDTMINPFSDTLIWTVDSLWRPNGPTIRRGANPLFSAALVFDSTRDIQSIVTMQDTVALGTWNADDGDPLMHEANPSWSEVRGSGNPIVMQDSLTHDGWRRTSAVKYLTFGSGSSTEGFAFDADQNVQPDTATWSFDGNTRRLTGTGSETFAYDSSGNQISNSTGSDWTYTYDALDRLTAVRYGGTLIARYGYDVLGRRIARRIYAAGPYNAPVINRRMIYRGSQVIAETNGSGTKQLAYTWGDGVDNLVAVHKYGTGSGNWYAVTDVLRSVRGLSKREGTWAASYRYRIYGALHDSAGAAPFELRYRWTGREFDQETGLYYFRSRYYNPAQFRFIQEDAAGYSGGANLYSYGNGGPTAGRDPDGMSMNYEMQMMPDHPVFQCMGTTEGCSSAAGGADMGWAIGWSFAFEFQAWVNNNVIASGTVKNQILQAYASNPMMQSAWAQLSATGRNFFVIDGDYLGNSCGPVGAVPGTDSNHCNGFAGRALKPQGSGAAAENTVTPGMETFLGTTVTGGVVWIRSSRAWVDQTGRSYGTMGELVWHELTHFLPARPLPGSDQSHDYRFCGVPGPRPPATTCAQGGS